MKSRHINIPIFIPHLGCPNNCVFCNQRYISGVKEFEAESVIPIIEQNLATVRSEDSVEIAFFGGSFTGIDRELMIRLLSIAKSYIDSGKVKSLRCSTRPDYITPEIIEILKEYGMTTVELGLQSASDKVLKCAGRGHTREDEERACRLIRENGIRLGGQMMIGLPDSTPMDEADTARFIVASGCDEARIYPTVVFRNTELAQMADRGVYVPLTLEEAVARTANALEILLSGGVKILRIGLCESENLRSEETYHSGPNHPAMGELVIGEYYYNQIKNELANTDARGKRLKVYISRGSVSKAVGHGRKNKNRILREYGCSEVIFRESSDISGYDVLLKLEERK